MKTCLRGAVSAQGWSFPVGVLASWGRATPLCVIPKPESVWPHTLAQLPPAVPSWAFDGVHVLRRLPPKGG